MNLKGKVKLVREVTPVSLDKKGNINNDSIPLSDTYYRFDNNGNLIDKKEKITGDDRITHTTVTIFKYDTTLDVIVEYSIDTYGQLYDSIAFIFNEKNQITGSIYYSKNGNHYNKDLYKYDKNGNKIEWKEYDSTGKVEQYETYGYDLAGNEIEFKSFLGTKMETGYANGKAVTHISNKLLTHIVYKYNKNGDVIEGSSYMGDGNPTIFKYEYKYDKQSNWNRRTMYSNGKAYQVTIREITYY
ncbi:MAG TPA: hypothetical protein VK783_03830 [Bacteroidia bacterium]|nr:hypothetical protein [Bacteroidia bacterium]